MPVAAVVAGSVISGAMGASASKKAANSQAAAADRANAMQMQQFETTRADNAPFRETGVAGNNRLAFLMGLNPAGGPTGSGSINFGGGVGGGISTQSLVDRSGGAPSYNANLYNSNDAYRKAWDDVAGIHNAAYGRDYDSSSGASWIEQNIRARLGGEISQDQEQQRLLAEQAKNDPAYGSLLRNFTMADRDADPVYQSGLQFGLDEGVKGLNRMAAASGSSQSGATLKALTRFANDYGSTKANESYNRFENNKNSTYNKLAGLSGAGQQATNQISAAGQNMANNISQNQIGVGNARAASAIGSANAWSNGIGQAYNGWQQNNLMNKMFPQSPGQATPLRFDEREIDGMNG